MTQYGVTSTGFVTKPQSVIASEINSSLQLAFGANLNLLPESVLGHLRDILAEREALVWQLAEAVYLSQYPAGAEGTSVDNILALNGLKRLGAAPTTATCVMTGTAGTTIPEGSLVGIPGSTAQFSTDAACTILAAVNAVQTVLFSNVPNSGHFKLVIVDPAGNTLTTGFITSSAAASDVQTALRALTDGMTTPYSAVTVSGTYATGFVVTFAGGAGGQIQNLMTSSSNTLQNGAVVTNISILDTVDGAPAEVSQSVTCTANGPTAALANSITQIVSSISGWTGVNNPLDATTGRDIESDTEAMVRRALLLAGGGTGSVGAIVAKILQLSGVTAARGFNNYTDNQDNSVQFVTFSAVPTSGNFKLQFAGEAGPETGNIAYSAAFTDVQTAIQALGGAYADALVTGSYSAGFVIEFDAALATQQLALVQSNTLLNGSAAVSTTVAGDIPSKSFEIVVEGGTTQDIVNAIGANMGGGERPYGTTGPTTYTDANGYATDIYFSRPVEVPIYISITVNGSAATFPADGAQLIQAAILEAASVYGIGDDVIYEGTNGIVGSFNSVIGMTSYSLTMGTTPSPSGTANIPIQRTQQAQIESFNIIITLNLT